MRLLPQRRWLRWSLLALLLLLTTVAVLVWHALDAHRLTSTLLHAAQRQTSLALDYEGEPAWTLRPDITLVLPTLHVRDPNNNATIARVTGLELRAPWDTARGRTRHLKHLSVEQVELHWVALQAWQAAQPPSDAPPFLPDLPAGLRISHLQVIGNDWQIEARPFEVTPLVIGQPGQLAMAAELTVGDQHGPLDLRGQLQLDPVSSGFSIALREATLGGNDWLPAFGGDIALPADGEAWLTLRGVLPSWPNAWPLLPAPMQARDVATTIDAEWRRNGLLALKASRDGTRIDTAFNPDDLQAWWNNGQPPDWTLPAHGTLEADALVIDGVSMEGLRFEVGDSVADDVDAPPR